MWYAPLATVDKFTFWAEGRKRILDLRLQNAPEDDVMDEYNEASSPSQISASFRLASAAGLPLCTLHDVFRRFQCETSMLLPNDVATAEAAVAWIAASRLCLKIADEFQKEDKRREAFDSCVIDLLREMEKQHILRPKSATHHSRIDRCMLVLCL